MAPYLSQPWCKCFRGHLRGVRSPDLSAPRSQATLSAWSSPLALRIRLALVPRAAGQSRVPPAPEPGAVSPCHLGEGGTPQSSHSDFNMRNARPRDRSLHLGPLSLCLWWLGGAAPEFLRMAGACVLPSVPSLREGAGVPLGTQPPAAGTGWKPGGTSASDSGYFSPSAWHLLIWLICGGDKISILKEHFITKTITQK